MYKKIISILIGALLFSMLFFKQQFGINLLFFSIVVLIFLFINYSKITKSSSFLISSILLIISSFFHFLYDSSYTIIVFTINFWYVIGKVTNNKNSTIVTLINGIFNTIASSFYTKFKQFDKKEKTNINYVFLSKIVLIPLVLVIIFVFLYKNANPIFNEYIKKINVNFINFKWFLFTCLGYYLFYNLVKTNAIESLTDADINLHVKVLKSADFNTESIRKENQIGIAIIASLCVLILLVISTDLMYLFSNNYLVNASYLSKQVHQGIYSIIASIILAISVIVFLFRKDLNFYKQNKNIKILSYLWIILNVILVIITSYKNYQYVYEFGMTYKRIGVFIYLFLVLIGLIITYQKIYFKNNHWFLIRKNIQFAFISLNVMVLFNWNILITNYNLNYAKTTDYNYLYTLPKTNSFILDKHAKENGVLEHQKETIENRLIRYKNELAKRSWQEFTINNLKIEQDEY